MRRWSGSAGMRWPSEGDVASLPDLDTLADRAKSEFGTFDALFVNAGVARTMPLDSTTEDVYDELFAINVKGAYFTVQKLAPLLSTGAGVVLTTSVANVMGLPETSVYAAGKAALRSMARSLSGELLPRGIRVNAISPGPVDTGILERSRMTEEAAEQFKKEAGRRTTPCNVSAHPPKSPGRPRSSPSMPPTPPAPNSPWTGAPPSSDPPRPLRSMRRARPRTYRNSSQMLSERTERNSSMSKETVLITGGTSGIGLATARLLHERGANVLVTGRNPETIRSARSALPDEVAILQADVASLDDTDRVVQHARERFGSSRACS